MNTKVGEYLSKAQKWQKEMEKLRKIILDCGLTEEYKWGKPCYSYKNSKIVLIQGFKKYLAVMFFKGYLLNDTNGMLIKPGENTRVMRQMRFADMDEIDQKEAILKAFIHEAIEIEKKVD